MEQAVNRYSNAEVLAHLVSGKNMDAAIRYLYQANFKSLSEYILHNQGSWNDVRAVVPYVIVQMIWLVQHRRYPAGTDIHAFLFTLSQQVWHNELRRRKPVPKPAEKKAAAMLPANETVFKAAEEKHVYEQWIRSFDLLGESCKSVLLQYYCEYHTASHSHLHNPSGKEQSGHSRRYGCLKKLEGVMLRHNLVTQEIQSGNRNKALYSDELLRFSEGAMSQEEETRFLEKLILNKALQQEANRLALEIEVVKYYGLSRQVISEQDSFLSRYSLPSPPKKSTVVVLKRLVRIGLAIAALVFLSMLIMAGSYFFQLSTEKLYEEAYVEYPISVTERRNSTPATIEEAYRQQNYAAVKKLSKVKRGYSDREFLLIGLSFLHLNDASSAIEPLRWVTRWPGSSYKPDAEYYLAMAYLKDKDYDKAMEVMQEIRSNPNHLYYDQFPNEYIRKVRLLKWR